MSPDNLTKLLLSRSEERNRSAPTALDVRVLSAMRQEFDQSDAFGKVAILQLIAEFGHSIGRLELREWLLESTFDSESKVRLQALWAIEQIIDQFRSDDDLLKRLLDVALDGLEIEMVREQALDCLCLIPPKRDLLEGWELVIDLCRNTQESSNIRKRAVVILAQADRSVRIEGILRELANSDPFEAVRYEAASVLSDDVNSTPIVTWLQDRFGMALVAASEWQHSLSLKRGFSMNAALAADEDSTTLTTVPVLQSNGDPCGLNIVFRFQPDEIRAKLEAIDASSAELIKGRKVTAFIPDGNEVPVIQIELGEEDLDIFRMIGDGPKLGWHALLNKQS